MNTEQEKIGLRIEIQQFRKYLLEKGKERKRKLLELLDLEEEVKGVKEIRDKKRERLTTIEEEEYEKVSEMSWEDENGRTKKKQIKNELQDEIKELKNERKEKIEEQKQIEPEIIRYIGVGSFKRNREYGEEIEKLTKEIEERYQKINGLYEKD